MAGLMLILEVDNRLHRLDHELRLSERSVVGFDRDELADGSMPASVQQAVGRAGGGQCELWTLRMRI